MKGKSHIIAGIATGITTAIFTFTGSVLGVGATIASSVLGSILPDIDLPNSKAGNKLKPIAKVINKLFGHRTITHAPLWLVPLFLLLHNLSELTSAFPIAIKTNLSCLLIGYISGFISHLLGDMLTKGGIPLFYPFKKHRYHLTPAPSGKYDALLIVITVFIYIVFYIVMGKFNLLNTLILSRIF